MVLVLALAEFTTSQRKQIRTLCGKVLAPAQKGVWSSSQIRGGKLQGVMPDRCVCLGALGHARDLMACLRLGAWKPSNVI